MKMKAGVVLWPLREEMRPALIVAGKVYKKYGRELLITSGLEGNHSDGSLHPYGYAIDTRIWYWRKKTQKKVADEIREELPFPFDVVLEKNNIHIEYDFTKL